MSSPDRGAQGLWGPGWCRTRWAMAARPSDGAGYGLAFLCKLPPPQQVDCARHINGSFLSIPPGWEGGMRGSPCPPPEADGTPGAGEGAEKLPPHSLIRPRTHVFILKHPWVLRPSQDSSDHRDSAAAYTNRVSLRR